MAGQIGQVTKITSRDLVVEFQPVLDPNVNVASPATAYAAYGEDMNHVTVLDLNGSTTGSVVLVVNGHRTDPIDVADLEGVGGAAVLELALEALPNVGTGGLVVTGDDEGPFTITAAAALENSWVVIEIVDDTSDNGLTQLVTTQGSTFYRLEADISSFSYTSTIETTDVTGIADRERRHASTVSDATWEATFYEALREYRNILSEGVEGYLRVFENGKVIGRRYFAWEVMLTEASSGMEAFEKIEIDVSGRRQGAPIARVGSIWNGV